MWITLHLLSLCSHPQIPPLNRLLLSVSNYLILFPSLHWYLESSEPNLWPTYGQTLVQLNLVFPTWIFLSPQFLQIVFFFLFIFQCVANKSSKSSLEHGWKVNKGHRVTSLLCFRLPSGSMPFFMQKPLALSSLSQQSRCQPTVLMLWSTCHSHLPVYSQQPPSILALLILHLASFVAGFSHNWLLLILHPLYLIVRTSLDTFIIKFPYTLLFLSCLLCSFSFILIYIFYSSVVWFLTSLAIREDRKHVYFTHLSIPGT